MGGNMITELESQVSQIKMEVNIELNKIKDRKVREVVNEFMAQANTDMDITDAVTRCVADSIRGYVVERVIASNDLSAFKPSLEIKVKMTEF